jgi:hypothetical protein
VPVEELARIATTPGPSQSPRLSSGAPLACRHSDDGARTRASGCRGAPPARIHHAAACALAVPVAASSAAATTGIPEEPQPTRRVLTVYIVLKFKYTCKRTSLPS